MNHHSSPVSASVLGHHGNRGNKNELEFTDTTEPFLRYTEDPLRKIQNPRPPRLERISKGKNSLQDDCKIGVPKKRGQNDQLPVPNPYLHCAVSGTDFEKLVDEMTPQKHKDVVQFISCLVIEDQISQPANLKEQELSKVNKSRQQEAKKLESERRNDNLLIPRCEVSDHENGVIGINTTEAVVQYVKVDLLDSGIQDFGTFEKLQKKQDDDGDDVEDVFFDLNPESRGNSKVPVTKAGKNHEESNTLNPSVVVCTPIQDTSLSSAEKEPHSLNSLEHSSSIPFEGVRRSGEISSNTPGSRLSYFSYLGEDLNKSWPRSSTLSSCNISEIQRMLSVSSCGESSFLSNASSPSSNNQSYCVAEVVKTDKLDQFIEYCSCMFCVKALFYHCTKDDCDSMYGEPCQCEQPSNECLKRWGFLSVLTCCMPCLLFYAPLKGFRKAAKRTKRFFRRKRKS